MTSSILICNPLISFSCHINLPRISSNILNRHGESEQPHLVPDFDGIPLNFSLFNLMLVFGFLYIVSFLWLGMSLGSLISTRQLSGRCVRYFQRLFQHPKIESCGFFLSVVAMVDYIDRLFMLKHPCMPFMKSIRSWWMIFLMHSWIQIASVLLSTFASLFLCEFGL